MNIQTIKGSTRQAVLLVLLAVSFFVLIWVAAPMLSKQNFWREDYEAYWLNGRAFLQGDNPYSLQTLQALKIEEGLSPKATDMVLRYPPWSMPFMALVGLFDYATGYVVWFLAYVAMVFGSAMFFWDWYQGPARVRWLAYVMTFLFAPVIFVIFRVQMAPWVLVGIALTLYFLHTPGKDFWAGASLLLISLKPHVPYLFLLALLFWVLYNRRWKILIGAGFAVLILMAVTLPINPALAWQFLTARQGNYVQLDWATPTLGFALRWFFGIPHTWLQFLPTIAGVLWAAWHWVSHKDHWDWHDQTPVLLLASTVTAPFIWTFDQVILVPVVMAGAAALARAVNLRSHAWLILIFLLGNLATIWMHLRFDDARFFWFAPAVSLWYWGAVYLTKKSHRLV